MLHLVFQLVLLQAASGKIVSVAPAPAPSVPSEQTQLSPIDLDEIFELQEVPEEPAADVAEPSETSEQAKEGGEEADAASKEAGKQSTRAKLLRPFAQLSGLAEADSPVRPVIVLGEEITEIDPLNMTVDLVDIMLGPVREANLLLPERLDPFAGQEHPKPLVPKLRKVDREEFKPSEQRRLLGSSLAVRDDTPHDKAKWQWQASAGGSFRQGNTSNTNIHSQFQGQRRSNRSVFSSKAGVNYNRNGEDEPNRRATGELILDRNLRGRWILYGREEAEYDQARFIDLRNIASIGLGFKFIDELDQRWVARTGPTVSHILYDGDAPDEDETKSGWLLESEYRHLIGETVRIEWTTSAFPNFDNERQFRIRSDAALLFPIGSSSSWSWKIGLRHDYQLDPVETTRSTDVEGYFSLTYSK